MWDLIYVLLFIVFVIIVCAGVAYLAYVGFDIVRRLLGYLEEKKEIRVTSEEMRDLGVHVKMHKPEHLKVMEKKFGIQLNFKKKDQKTEAEKQ